MNRFECHSHSTYSNLRLLDSINKPEDLIDRAYKLGLAGIALTDHESLSAHMEIDNLIKKYSEIDPAFKIARGNEIYLVDERGQKQKYYHFILIAKDAIGHKALRELSSIAWLNSYFDRGMERVPTTKQELSDIVHKYGKGHLIASTACLGGELDSCILEMVSARKKDDRQTEKEQYNKIINLITFCKELFNDDFYLEVQPAKSKEQLIVNNIMNNISRAFDVKIIVTTDAHYLSKEDRWVHKAYLNSKGGEREVDSFYEFAYLQSTEEVIENLAGTDLDYYELEKNTIEIYNKIETYSLMRKQQVPQIKVKDYPRGNKKVDKDKYPILTELISSDNEQERYWVNECLNKLEELNLANDTYLARLEEEADIQKVIGEKLETCMFSYPIFLQHYIDLFWECGSTVGAGRGSACSGLNHYLLGITQLDPIVWDLPY